MTLMTAPAIVTLAAYLTKVRLPARRTTGWRCASIIAMPPIMIPCAAHCHPHFGSMLVRGAKFIAGNHPVVIGVQLVKHGIKVRCAVGGIDLAIVVDIDPVKQFASVSLRLCAGEILLVMFVGRGCRHDNSAQRSTGHRRRQGR